MKKAVIFDIAPEAIRTTLVEYGAGSLPKITQADVLSVPGGALVPVFGVAHADQLRSAYAKLPVEYLRGAKVHVVLHSPFVETHLRSVGKTFPTTVTVTAELLDAVIGLWAEFFLPSIPSVRIERKVFLSKLNGYPVLHPLGRRAREVSVSFCESHLTKDSHQKIISLVGGDFHTVPISTLSVVRDILGKGGDMTLIHVGSLSTDVGVVRGGVLAGIRSFPRGSRAFALRLQEKIAPAFSEAESLVRLFLENSLAPDSREVVSKIHDDVRRMWLGELVGADRPATSTVLMPRKAFLFGDPLGVALYQDLLASDASSRGVLDGTQFEVESLSPRTLATFLDIPNGILPDIYHLLSALCITHE